MNTEKLTDVVIITALPKERDEVLKYLGDYEEIKVKDRTFYKASITDTQSREIYQIKLVSLPSMGNIQAAIAAQWAISAWNPSFIILAGIAGGMREKQTDSLKEKQKRYLGDVVVAEQIVYYELGKKTPGSTQSRYQAYRPARVLLDAAKALEQKQQWAISIGTERPDGTTGRVIPRVLFGIMASGDKVIADDSTAEALKSDWVELVGIEMEAAGIATAAYESEQAPGFLVVKGICDWADPSKNDQWQKYAAEASASFVVELLKTKPFESRSRPQPVERELPNTYECYVWGRDFESKIEPQPRIDKKRLYSGKTKVYICRKLQSDWQELADLCDIPKHYVARFEQGRQAYDIWDWLEERSRLSALEEALELLERYDLLAELRKVD
ncbi:MAG: 5'-methylthioadenosine/S-adenosylhomocysteine nucleosidase [Leptolyngbyaceae cyanobacterium MO_188.B28]|nr:5'-methylthioadenosine/S-adenosylhomocysteine nucleosidase [Leptolyngbyaceae cyanobacterium MO_188.B28]